MSLSRVTLAIIDAAAMEMLSVSPLGIGSCGRFDEIRKVPSMRRQSGCGARFSADMAMANSDAFRMLIRSISIGSTIPTPMETA